MSQEELDQLHEWIYNANHSPIQQACCFICDYCDVYKDTLRCHCRYHDYDLLNAHDSICFQYRPLRNK